MDGVGDVSSFTMPVADIHDCDITVPLLFPQKLSVCWLGELLIRFQDVVFLSSRASLAPHSLGVVVEVGASGLPHVLSVVVEGKQGYAPCKILLLQEKIFCVIQFPWRS